MGNLLRVILKASDGFPMLSWFARRRVADISYFILVGTRGNSATLYASVASYNAKGISVRKFKSAQEDDSRNDR